MSAVKIICTTLPVVIGTFAVGTLAPAGSISATENPFTSRQLPGGYMVAAEEISKGREGKCGEGKRVGKSEREAVCGIYNIGSAHKDDSRVKDGKCGGHKVVEALCGEDR